MAKAFSGGVVLIGLILLCVAAVYGTCGNTHRIQNSILGALQPQQWPTIPEWVKPVPLVPPKVEIDIQGHWVPTQVYTPADTLPVTVDIDISPKDTTCVINIDGKPVIIDSLHIEIEPFILRWSIFEEFTDNNDMATGISWTPVRFWGISVGPFVSSDIPEFDWVSIGVRGQRQIHTTFGAGLELGHRIGDGVHVGGSLGVSF